MFIGFEGPIGAGKTTLAQWLAELLGSTIILERFDENEFLADFYGDQQRWSVCMQLSFLTSRYQQLVHGLSSSPATTVADYTYAKDLIFASILLAGRELRLYKALSNSLGLKAPQADLVIYLDAPDEVLIERIRKRGRRYESAIDEKYLADLREGYENYFSANTELRILRYNTANLDLKSISQMSELQDRILAMLPKPDQI